MKFSKKHKLLYDYLVKYKSWAILGSLFMILSVLMLIPTPLLTMYLLDNVIPLADTRMLFFICIVCFFILLLKGLFSNLQNYYFSKFNHKVIFDIQLKAFQVIQKTSSQYRNRLQTGYLMARIKDDPNRLQSLFAEKYTSIIKDIITLIVGICIIIYLHWKLAIISLLLLPLFVFTLRHFSIKIKTISSIVFELSANISKKLQESLSLINTLVSFNAEKYDAIKFVNVNKPYIKNSIKRTIIQNLATTIVSTISGIGPIIVLGYGVFEIINNRLTIGQLIAFNAFLGYIFGPTSNLVDVFLNMQHSFAAWDRIYEVLKTPKSNKKELENDQISKQIDGEIIFKNVYFQINNTCILNNINLQINKKQTIGIVGESGAGKSTIINLIVMLNKQNKGLITVDGVDISKIKGYRKQIALLQQEPILFTDSIKNNIKLGKLNATDAEIINAAKKALIHDYINSLPEKYNAIVDERGLNMSIGQKQRIAIARCIIRNPAIFLMDEPTANLDAETEKLLIGGMLDFIKSRTTIIAAHHLSTIAYVDKIIVLDKGMVAEFGSHNELLNLNGIYSRLWFSQNSSINKKLYAT